MKKALGLVGSPRINGNTHLLVEQILVGAREKGAETEVLLLNDLKIKECDGCHACWNHQKCSKKDDMSALYPRIMETDIMIFGTPVYWYGPTALIKGFIDRMVYFNCPENRSGIRGKKVVIVIPFEEENISTVEPVITFFERCFHYLEVDLVGKIIVPGVTERGEVAEKRRVMTEAYQLGHKLIM